VTELPGTDREPGGHGLGTTFRVRTGLWWRVAARAPVSAGLTISASSLLFLLATFALVPSATSSSTLAAYAAGCAALSGARPGWFAWRWWRYHVHHGPPRLTIGSDGVSVIADGHTADVAGSAAVRAAYLGSSNAR
jgi:hypothetical protein